MLDIIGKIIAFIPLTTVTICLIYSFFENKKSKNKRIELDINLLKVMLSNIPTANIKTIEFQKKQDCIKLSIIISAEGVADTLMGNSPVDKIKEEIRNYTHIVAKPYIIKLFLE